MPPQQVETAETIAALKRALRRDHRPVSSVSISQMSNRGNKLKRGAEFVHQGSLAYIKGPEVYKEKIEHAGYTRYILERNPPRYNDYGDELDESDNDEEADAWAAEENPYDGLKLEELLCPLKHPSELLHHPTLAEPYRSNALPNTIKVTNEKLRKEKADLARLKDLYRQLIGDEAWLPCESVETPDDWDLFEPRWHQNGIDVAYGKKRKRNDGAEEAHSITSTTNIPSIPDVTGANIPMPRDIPSKIDQDAKMADVVSNQEQEDIAGERGVSPATHTNGHKDKQNKVDDHEAKTIQSVPMADADVEMDRTAGTDETVQPEGTVSDEIMPDKTQEGQTANEADGERKASEDNEAASQTASHSASASPAPPPRRITRALAQATDNNESGRSTGAPTPPLSPSPSAASTSLTIAPLYLIPALHPPPSLGLSPFHLPLAEHSDTVSLLTSYIQKQSAFVSTLESIVARLLQADRLRRTVFHWCKAEGHVGELSDGEDWIDEEEWGLEKGELKKGKGDEEDVDAQQEYLGRKGKRRRGGGAG